ncbi:type IV toxin-antitoxin system AbiEi family antitoxin domain-containing protein [Streptomyces brevispora]|uniref:type IV toxin-antitoxin system AbiEi family antitoxin domain-containing protein n=1 Tax=Streptomyces brevispora TaxID=887462 RepID=UPI0037226925
MDRAEQLVVLSGAAADQWGLVTAAQAKELGLNAVQLLRLAEAGLLENVSRGVYLLPASGIPRHVEIKAAWLRLQPKAFVWDRPAGHPDSGVISHASACQLHELGDIPAPDVEITVPRRRTTTEPFVRLRTAMLDPAEITIVEGLPVTTATRTITDLLQAKADGGHIGGVIAEAARRDLIIPDDLAARVEVYARKYGLKTTATGRDLIDHLVEQAGESLRRREVARASREGFDAAVHLIAEHPSLAALAHSRPERQRTWREAQDAVAALLGTYPHVTASAGLDRTLQAAIAKLNVPNPGLQAAIAKLNMPNPGLQAAIRNATALPQVTSKAALDSGASSTAPRQQAPASALPRSHDSDPDERSVETETND